MTRRPIRIGNGEQAVFNEPSGDSDIRISSGATGDGVSFQTLVQQLVLIQCS